MLGDTDLTDPHQLEGLRRSIAMLPANSYERIFTRAEAMRLLTVLGDTLRSVPDQST